MRDDSRFNYITLKVPLHQNIGGGSTSKMVRREPLDPNRWDLALRMMKEFITFEGEPGKKWCGHCAEWHDKRYFRKDASNRDGLYNWCKMCEAAEKKRRYWLQKDSELMWEQWHRRHIERVYFDETKFEQAA